jgi:hypothetical protein
MRVAPPNNTSPAAGKFVCGLLHPDWRKRLGTGGAKDVKAASFFRGLDWDLAQRGGLPPALGRFDGAGPHGSPKAQATGARSLVGEGSDAVTFDVADCAVILGKYVAGAEGEENSGGGVNRGEHGGDSSSGNSGALGSSSSGGVGGADFSLGLRRVAQAPPVAPPRSSSGEYGWDDDEDDEVGYGHGALDRRRAASLAGSSNSRGGFGSSFGPSLSPGWGSSSSGHAFHGHGAGGPPRFTDSPRKLAPLGNRSPPHSHDRSSGRQIPGPASHALGTEA